MDAEQDEVAGRFTHDLVQLHQMAGRPSYSTLERVSRHQLKRATVSDVLNGKRVKLPDWRFVSAFVIACRNVAEGSGLDSQELGTVADWKHHWDTATTGLIDARFPGRGRPAAASLQPVGVDAERSPTAPGPPSSASEPEPAPSVAGTSLPPPVWGPVPRQIRDFVGRESLLGDLHQSFVRGTRRSALAIQGLGGIGKTQLAVEYAHRHVTHYDLVWWISCDTRGSAHRGMADLESRLGLARAPASPREQRFAAVFDALRLGRPYERWLLVFDNADDPDEVKDLIPPRQGHVLITSRNNRWEASEEMVELDVFTRQESVEFLRRRMRGLSEADAQRLADAAGDLPLVLEHAADSRISAEEYLAQIERSPVRLFSANQPSGYPVPVADTWRTVTDRLSREAPDAMGLLRCLAFFGSDPIPLEALERGRFLPEISLHALLRDSIRRSRAIGALGRTGLLSVSPATRTLQVHRLTQSIVRDTLTREEAEQWRHDVHLLLAAADPGNPDDSDYWPRYDELRGHMSASDVEGCRDVTVRRLAINVVGYLQAAGDPVAALTLADRAFSRWSAEASTENADSQTAALAMQRSKADALFSLGLYQESLELNRTILDKIRSAPNKRPKEILILGRTVGAELRIQGKFAAALEIDAKSAEQHVDGFGHDHPQTLIAMNNLAIDNGLNGNYEEAVQISGEVYRDCRVFYGRADHPSVLSYQNSLARNNLLAGRYREALELAEEVHRGYSSIIAQKILNEDHPWVLTHEIDLAATRRDVGLSDAAFDELASQIHDVHQSCWRAFGVGHPRTLAAAVTLGSLLRRIAGRVDEAAAVVADAERRYGSTLGTDHPYAYACTAVLAGIRRQAGAPEEAVSLLADVVAGLKSTVGQAHPYTLDAVAALVNAMTDAGNAETALPRGQEVLASFCHVLGPDHPHTLACAASVTTILSALARQSDATALRSDTLERYLRTLGEEHPHVQMFVAGERFDPDFTPLPL